MRERYATQTGLASDLNLIDHEKHSNPYPKFVAMIATSTVVMFGLMYLNTYALDHVFFSETRTYMAIYMGATMAINMLAFMLGMYKNVKAKSPFSPGARSSLRSRFGSFAVKERSKRSPG